MKFRYFLPLRPVSLGTQPNGFTNYENFEKRQFCPEIGHEAWGWVEYESSLSDDQIRDYDLIPMPKGNAFKNFRKRYGSRQKFSEMSGIGTRTLEAYEQGLRDVHSMTARCFKQIADAAGISLDELWKEIM